MITWPWSKLLGTISHLQCYNSFHQPLTYNFHQSLSIRIASYILYICEPMSLLMRLRLWGCDHHGPTFNQHQPAFNNHSSSYCHLFEPSYHHLSPVISPYSNPSLTLIYPNEPHGRLWPTIINHPGGHRRATAIFWRMRCWAKKAPQGKGSSADTYGHG